MSRIAIGADVGGSHLSCAAVDIHTGGFITGHIHRGEIDHRESAQQVFAAWADLLNACIAESGGAVEGIGFAVPGPFDYARGISEMEHKFPKLYKMHIPSRLKSFIPESEDLPMRFLNDATSFAVGEAWQGAGRGHSRVVVVTLGTGLGSAFVEDGIPVVSRDDVPSEGCLWHLRYQDSIADKYFSTGWFERAYKKRTNTKIKGVLQLVENIEVDEVAKELFSEFGRNLGSFLSPWLVRFKADKLIFGGNISHAYVHFAEALQDAFVQAGLNTEIAISSLMEHGAILGGARLLQAEFWKKVSRILPNI